MSFTANIGPATPQPAKDTTSVAAADHAGDTGGGFAQQLGVVDAQPEAAADAAADAALAKPVTKPGSADGSTPDAPGQTPDGQPVHHGGRSGHAQAGRGVATSSQAPSRRAATAGKTAPPPLQDEMLVSDPAALPAVADADQATAGSGRPRAKPDGDDSRSAPATPALPLSALILPAMMASPVTPAAAAAAPQAAAPGTRPAGAIGVAVTGRLDAADAAIAMLEQASRGAVASGRDVGRTEAPDDAGQAGIAGADQPAGAIALPAVATTGGVAGSLLTAVLQDARRLLQRGAAAADDSAVQTVSGASAGLAVAGALDAFSSGVLQQAIPGQVADPGPAAKQHQELAQALGERLDVQISQGVESATIRLDPPMKGSIEILVRQDQGAVQVHLRASDPDVQRQLQNIGDSLRQDLMLRNHRDVSVQVWDSTRGQGQGRQQKQDGEGEEPGPGLAWEQSDEARGARFGLNQQGEAA